MNFAYAAIVFSIPLPILIKLSFVFYLKNKYMHLLNHQHTLILLAFPFPKQKINLLFFNLALCVFKISEGKNVNSLGDNYHLNQKCYMALNIYNLFYIENYNFTFLSSNFCNCICSFVFSSSPFKRYSSLIGCLQFLG